MINNYFFIKRLIDLIMSIIGLITLSPFFLLIPILLFLSGCKNPFFIQKRSGLNGKSINVIKFKTMSDKKDKNGKILPDVDRITKLGNFLRNTSLDEIPQFINILKNDMSLIGPRPLYLDYIPLYSEFQKRRLEIKPGITGWAQINGRNAISWNQKFKFDVWYVDNVSFFLDIKIIFLTIIKIVFRSNISSNNHVTMSKFTGNN
tara:strand:- start:449 stop:1060 length:612 start_codon:yes stop_codon:yes gene_type:complete